MVSPSAAKRATFKDAKTVVIKVGTTVVSQSDGSLALGRIASIVEQIARLHHMGKQVLLVASGSIGVGGTRLSEQRVLSKSIREHLMHDAVRDPRENGLSIKAKAAAGQGGLMGLYDTLFSQYSVVCGQLLVTEVDFKEPNRRSKLFESITWLLEHGAVPVLNENDVLAIPSQRQLFVDNDSLAVIIACELGADVLMLLSDVEGVFSKKPQPGEDADLLPIFTPDTKVQFGEKSERGRGGMEAKVSAAVAAAEHIGAVLIGSGLYPDTITRIMDGEELGTCFISRAEMQVLTKAAGKSVAQVSPAQQARNAREAARALQQLGHKARVQLLLGFADALEASAARIGAANKLDIEAAAAANMTGPMAARLHMPPRKIKGVADGIRSLAAQEDPLGKVKRHVEVSAGLTLVQETVPIGVLLIIFESRPDVLPQVAALSVATGNGVLLKGGKEAAHTNAVLHAVLCETITRVTRGAVSPALVSLVEGRSGVAELLKLSKEIDLVIPRGSNAMVQHIMRSTRIPTLGHADGICHMYIDASASMEKAAPLIVDSKTDYPAACNALETLLLHRELVDDGRARGLLDACRRAQIKLYGGPRAARAFGLPAAASLRHEYGELAMAVEVVDGVGEAVEHINSHGSGHTDVIVAEDGGTAEAFLSRVDSADVFHNCSSRFADGYRFGLGAEVGISTARVHARGPVGVDGLLTTRNRLTSTDSHTVADFASGRRKYSHKNLMGGASQHSRL